jgi:eukaryotic-like serine/threonine-protein kinase
MEAGEIVGGKYRLTREIGEGSMGTVWAAVHELLGREVAIKFLSPSFEDARTSQARFVAEAKAAAQVKHRYVVDVFDFGITEGGVSYMVQELLKGEPLADAFYHGPAWPLRDAVRFLEDTLSGLAAVHERGVVHRDLKPENIFVEGGHAEGRTPKLLDFGISKAAARSSLRVPRPSIRAPGMRRLTAAGATLGTPAYMSPEQLRNLSSLDARADVYSMGVVLYEWLAGHCPFASTTNYAELLDRVLARAMRPLEELRPDIGAELCAVVARAIEPDREARFGSALEMRAALARVRDQLPDVPTAVQSALPESALRIPSLPPPSLDVLAYEALRLPAPARLPSVDGGPRILLQPRAPREVDDGLESLRPAGLRRGPSKGLLAGAALAALGVILAVSFVLGPHSGRDAAHAADRPARAVSDQPQAVPAARDADEVVAQQQPTGPGPTLALEHAPAAPELALPVGEAPPPPLLEAEPTPGARRGHARTMPEDGLEAVAARAQRHEAAAVEAEVRAAAEPAPAPVTAPAPPPTGIVRSLDF